ncbi:MAG: FtsX-like permease family protein, partial [Vicinamibacterales bacterium]
CANVANLMLARSGRRAREIAVRASLGASRRRIVRQLLIEGGVLATVGGVVGLVLAFAGVRLFRTAIPENVLPYWFDYSLDGSVVSALVAVSVASVFAFALLPAIHASRSDVNLLLKDGGRTGTERRGRWWTTAFLAAEFGLAVVLLSHFVVNLRSSAPTLPSDPVIDESRVLTATITLPAQTYSTPEQRASFYSRLNERISALPSISAVSMATALPLTGAQERRVDIAGRRRESVESQPTVWSIAVGPRYFDTLSLPVVRGREFTEEDGAPGLRHAIVNERFAQQFLGEGDPIGQRIAISPKDADMAPEWLTVVGVAPSIRQRRPAVPDAVVYLPFRSTVPANGFLLVRSSMETAALASLVRREAQEVDASLPLYRIRTIAQTSREAEWNGRVSSGLFLALTFIAVLLSTVGLYAVTAHGVSQRTQEIGVRMALGAQPRHVVRLITRRVALQLGLGFMAGVACTRIWDWMFSSGRADVTATDPGSLIGVAAILTVVAMIACFLPARRATRLDPVAAIRHD